MTESTALPPPRLTAAGVTAVGPDGQEVVLLHPVDLHLTQQRIAIIGANGSGKSTLLRLLNGLVLPTTGTVTVHGHRTDQAANRVRKTVGFVFTDPDAQLVMPTAIEDIALSLRRLKLSRAERDRQAAQILAQYGLGDRPNIPVQQLSGGQRQLLAIAGVLATQPALVVCDEPTTLLDLRHSERIASLLFSLPQQLIIATHDLQLAARAQRVLVIDGGRVIVDDEPTVAISAYRQLMGAHEAV